VSNKETALETPNANEALERLKQGNERFRNSRTEGHGHVSSHLEKLVQGQHPFAIILSCSDSRVQPTFIFDTTIGDLFVIRIAGNIASWSSIASVEFAVANLGAKLIVVLAHQSCGAVNAAIKGGDYGRNLNHVLQYIQPALEPPEKDADVVARRNAHNSAKRLIDESDIIREAVAEGGVKIVTAFFHLTTGEVEFD
jgi:carbonic anhydrase